MRRLEAAVLAMAAALLLAAAWLSLAPALPVGGKAGSDYVQSTRAYDDAVASGDASNATDRVLGNALIQLRSQLALDSQEGLLPRATRSPSSIQLLSGSDGAPEVQIREAGIEHLDIAQPPGYAVIATRARTYSRVVTLSRSGSRYLLSNQSETSAPAAWWDLWGSAALRGLLLVGAAGLLLVTAVMYRRRRSPAQESVPAAAGLPGGQTNIPVASPQTDGRNTITCFGGLRITVAGEDLTARLMARPVIAFIWVYLLVLEIRRPGSRVSRTAVADEVFAGLPSQTQRERLRDRLRDIRSGLPDSLGRCIVQTGETTGFEPAGWTIDAIELQRMAQQIHASATNDLPGGWPSVEGRWSGDFIPEWEELERVTEGRGTSHELINEMRLELEGSLVDVSTTAAERLLMLGDPAAAVRVAERAISLRPDREDVRNVLVRAYAQAGRHQAAAETSVP